MSVLDQVSALRILFISVCNRSDINVLDQVSVLTIMLMPMCRSEINKSKSDLGVRLGINVKVNVNISVY